MTSACRFLLSRMTIRLRRWGVVDSNMVVEHDSRREPFGYRDSDTSRPSVNSPRCASVTGNAGAAI